MPPSEQRLDGLRHTDDSAIVTCPATCLDVRDYIRKPTPERVYLDKGALHKYGIAPAHDRDVDVIQSNRIAIPNADLNVHYFASVTSVASQGKKFSR
jgi:hypothetical protein